ncbi:MAG: hypothetical protein ACTHMU_01880 [Thermomicrobiales bacterium]
MSLDTVGRRPRDATPLYRLAHYQITYQPDKRQLKSVTEPRLFEAPHRSPQLPLWEVGEGEWLQVLRLPDYAPRRRRAGVPRQPPLFSREGVAGARADRLGDGHA